MLVQVILITLIFLTSQKNEKYMEIKLSRKQSSSSIQHLIHIEINRYQYVVSLALSNQKEYFLNLNQARLFKQKTSSPDYRKNQQNIFGIIQYMGVENADQNLSLYSQIKNNFYFWIRDFNTQKSWFNMQQIEQFSYKQRPSNLSQGLISLSPINHGQYMNQVRKYSKYVKQSIATIYKLSNTQTILILGSFPNYYYSDEMITTGWSSRKLHDKQWGIFIRQGYFSNSINKDFQDISLFKYLTTFRININSRLLVLPKDCKKYMEEIHIGKSKQCKFLTIDHLNTNNYFVCYQTSQHQAKSSILKFRLNDQEKYLSIPLSGLIIEKNKTLTIFSISLGDDDSLQIGESILDEYTIGIHMQQNQFYFAQKSFLPLINRSVILGIIIIIHCLVFLLSLIVLILRPEIRIEIQKLILNQLAFDKTDYGYLKAITQENCQ